MKFRKKPVVVDAEQYKGYRKLVTGMCRSTLCSVNRNAMSRTSTQYTTTKLLTLK